MSIKFNIISIYKQEIVEWESISGFVGNQINKNIFMKLPKYRYTFIKIKLVIDYK